MNISIMKHLVEFCPYLAAAQQDILQCLRFSGSIVLRRVLCPMRGHFLITAKGLPPINSAIWIRSSIYIIPSFTSFYSIQIFKYLKNLTFPLYYMKKRSDSLRTSAQLDIFRNRESLLNFVQLIGLHTFIPKYPLMPT